MKSAWSALAPRDRDRVQLPSRESRARCLAVDHRDHRDYRRCWVSTTGSARLAARALPHEGDRRASRHREGRLCLPAVRLCPHLVLHLALPLGHHLWHRRAVALPRLSRHDRLSEAFYGVDAFDFSYGAISLQYAM